MIGELLKQTLCAQRSVGVFHFRDRSGAEVDAILEDGHSGRICGIEAKATSTPRPADGRHLVKLRDVLGDRFSVGVVIHLGDQVLSLGDRLWAVPFAALTREE